MNKTITPFAQHFQDALQAYLKGPSEHPNSARLIGREALESGISKLDLVRTYDEAMMALSNTDLTVVKNMQYQLSAGGCFIVEALAVLEEQSMRDKQTAYEALQRANEELERKSTCYSKLLIESRQLAHKLLLVQEEERREISRELHDEVAQILAGIHVRLAALKEQGSISQQNLEQSICQTQQMIEESVVVVHRYARKLRPALLDDLGLCPALRSFIKELPRPNELEIIFTEANEVEKMDNVRRTVFYRVTQEALQNIVHHAEAKCATVELLEIQNGIRLVVHDDGKAFAVDEVFASKDYTRLGLIGMKERVEMVSGKFSIDSAPGKGTTVSAEIPFLANFEESSL